MLGQRGRSCILGFVQRGQLKQAAAPSTPTNALLFIRVGPDLTQPRSDIILESSELKIRIHMLRAQPFSLCSEFLLSQLP